LGDIFNGYCQEKQRNFLTQPLFGILLAQYVYESHSTNKLIKIEEN